MLVLARVRVSCSCGVSADDEQHWQTWQKAVVVVVQRWRTWTSWSCGTSRSKWRRPSTLSSRCPRKANRWVKLYLHSAAGCNAQCPRADSLNYFKLLHNATPDTAWTYYLPGRKMQKAIAVNAQMAKCSRQKRVAFSDDSLLEYS